VNAANVDAAMRQALRGRLLLEHPFYRRWEAGALEPGELGRYAEQYRHAEAMLPGFLRAVAGLLPPGAPRRLVEANLADEEGDPVAHLDLFEGFASAAGAGTDEPASPATAALVASYAALAEEGPVPALAGLAAYEVQASDVAASKAEGLRRHYGFGAGATRFWDHHERVERRHALWTTAALASLGASPAAVRAPARRVADAWWSFLDEREAAAPAPA